MTSTMNTTGNTVHILGGAQTDFERNWTKEGKGIVALLKEVVTDGLENAGLSFDDVIKLNRDNRVACFVGNFIAEKYTEQGHLGAFLTEVDEAFYGVPSARYEAACASGSQAVGLAALLIRNGLQDCVVCGGAQEANMFGVASFDGIQSFALRDDNDPSKASRPFDSQRNGLVPGGGAATLVVESYESAVKRGAPILAEIVSWGFSGNGDHISTPNVEGPARSLELCLEKSGINIREIGYVNAHATSTKIGDSREAQAIARIFGDYRVPVTSTKSQTGHEMWMAGASEIIYSMLMMKNDFIAGNINFENPDEETACVNVLPETKEAHFDIFLSNSFGFGGTNSTLIVKNL